MIKEAKRKFKRLEIIFHNIGNGLYKKDWSGEEINTLYSVLDPKEPTNNVSNARTRADDIRNIISQMIENNEFAINILIDKEYQEFPLQKETIHSLNIPDSYLKTKDGRLLECELKYIGKGSIYDGAKRGSKPRHNIEVVRPIVIKAMEDMIKESTDITYDSIEHYLKSNDIYKVGHDWLNRNLSKEVEKYQAIQDPIR